MMEDTEHSRIPGILLDKCSVAESNMINVSATPKHSTVFFRIATMEGQIYHYQHCFNIVKITFEC